MMMMTTRCMSAVNGQWPTAFARLISTQQFLICNVLSQVLPASSPFWGRIVFVLSLCPFSVSLSLTSPCYLLIRPCRGEDILWLICCPCYSQLNGDRCGTGQFPFVPSFAYFVSCFSPSWDWNFILFLSSVLLLFRIFLWAAFLCWLFVDFFSFFVFLLVFCSHDFLFLFFFVLLSFVASQGRWLGLGLVLGRSQRNYKLVRWQVALLSSCDWNSIVLPARQTDRRPVRAPCSWCVLDSFSNLSADRLHWQVCSQQIASRCNPSASSNERTSERAPAESITFLEESNSWMRQRHWVSERKIETETEGDGDGDGQRELQCKSLKKTLNSFGMKEFCIQLTCGRK